jgi:hypothetical protein
MRFYTNPPKDYGYPYFMLNPKYTQRLLKEDFKHAILDCGIEIFNKLEVKNYPEKFLDKWKATALKFSDLCGSDRLWVVIPDYCDDLLPGSLGDNVGKTLENIEGFITVDKVSWVVSLQARYRNPFSFAEAVQGVHDLIGKYPRIAIGTICKTRKISFIEQSCKFARRHFPDSRIHGFGLTLSALPKVLDSLDSFDSMAWCFPRKDFKTWTRETGYKPFLNSAPAINSKTIFYFEEYLKAIRKYTDIEGGV